MQASSASDAPSSNETRRSSDISTERILDAAAMVFGEKGYEAARVADIARRSGLTTGALYARWLTKQELFLAAIEQRGSTRTEVVSGQAELSAARKLADWAAGCSAAVTAATTRPATSCSRRA